METGGPGGNMQMNVKDKEGVYTNVSKNIILLLEDADTKSTFEIGIPHSYHFVNIFLINKLN